MHRFVYPARLEPASRWDPDERGHVVGFRDLPEAITQGEDEHEALSMATDALRVAIEGRMRHGDAVPRPSRPRRDEHPVALEGLLAAKAALHVALAESGLSRSELARRLGVDEKEVRRLLDPRHHSRLDRLQAALGLLGKRLVIEMHDGA